jgi:hypothetical protein
MLLRFPGWELSGDKNNTLTLHLPCRYNWSLKDIKQNICPRWTTRKESNSTWEHRVWCYVSRTITETYHHLRTEPELLKREEKKFWIYAYKVHCRLSYVRFTCVLQRPFHNHLSGGTAIGLSKWRAESFIMTYYAIIISLTRNYMFVNCNNIC